MQINATYHLSFDASMLLAPVGVRLLQKILFVALTMISLAGFQSAVAGALGMPENTAKLGYAIGAAYLSVDDPVNKTGEEWAAVPVTLIHANWLFKDIRYWSEIYYYTATLDAAVNRVGQNVERYGVRFSLQKSLRLTRAWAPWFGVGMGVSQVSYTTRHTVDADGYLLDVYPDREQTAVALLFNMVSEWPLTRNLDIAAKLEGAMPVDGDVEEYSALISLLYRY